MDRFVIVGGKPLSGKVKISGSKNSVLPLVAASLFIEGKTRIRNCPKIKDVIVMAEIIERLGGKFYFDGEGLVLDTVGVDKWIMPEDLSREIRASAFLCGALTSKFGFAEMACPGGCDIGERPLDIHIDALASLGIFARKGERILFDARKAKSGLVRLRYPSVGATENVVMAAARLEGVTRIENCAREPEIKDLQDFLNAAGFKVCGAGSGVMEVTGAKRAAVKEMDFEPRRDRIEAGTFILAGAAVGGEIEVDGFDERESCRLREIVAANACKIVKKNDKIYHIEFKPSRKGFGRVIAEPYPGFPTDLQPQIAAAAAATGGFTVVEDRVFPSRFAYVEQLKKMGADAILSNGIVLIEGRKLTGAVVSASDLRGGAALCVAGLAAEGKTTVLNASIVDRGYEGFEDKLTSLGADIKRIRL